MGKYLIILNFILVIIISGCVNNQPQKNTIIDELDKLKIQTTKFNKQFSMNLPEKLSDANWGLKKIICEEGGYDLAKHANQTVNLQSYRTNKYYQNEQLNVWIITNEDEVICVYLTVDEASTLAPGVFSVNDPNVIEK